jgi:adenosylcobinamide-phosphate synthase
VIMPVATTLLILVAALGIEAAFGYPQQVYRIIGHPVTWIGALIGKLDRELNWDEDSDAARKTLGVGSYSYRRGPGGSRVDDRGRISTDLDR